MGDPGSKPCAVNQPMTVTEEEAKMITLNVSELHEVAVVVATSFPILAAAYYSAARHVSL